MQSRNNNRSTRDFMDWIFVSLSAHVEALTQECDDV